MGSVMRGCIAGPFNFCKKICLCMLPHDQYASKSDQPSIFLNAQYAECNALAPSILVSGPKLVQTMTLQNFGWQEDRCPLLQTKSCMQLDNSHLAHKLCSVQQGCCMPSGWKLHIYLACLLIVQRVFTFVGWCIGVLHWKVWPSMKS